MSQRLGDLLVKEKVITTEQLDQAVKMQKESNCRLGTALVKLGFLTDEDVGFPCIGIDGGRLRRAQLLPLLFGQFNHVYLRLEIVPSAKHSSKSRSPALPDTPSMTEAGYPEVVGESWFAAVVPTGTSKEIITLLQREIARAITLPDMRERGSGFGYSGAYPASLQFWR